MSSSIEPPAEEARDEPPYQPGVRAVMIGVTLMSVVIALQALVEFTAAEHAMLVGWLLVAVGARTFFGIGILPWFINCLAAAGIVFASMVRVLDAFNLHYDRSAEHTAQAFPFSITWGFFFGSVGWILVECAFLLIVWLDETLPGGSRNALGANEDEAQA